MDWQILLENLTTDAILSHLKGVDPVTVATNPYVAGCALLVILGLLFFRMIRTLAVLAGLFALWVAVAYAMPQNNTDVSLESIGIFAGICLGVVGCWIYIFFIRGD